MSKAASLALDGVRESTTTLTNSLRAAALESGWSPKEAAGISVTVSGTDLSVEVAGKNTDAREFGDESTPPNPAIRRWLGDTTDISSVVASSMIRRLLEGLQ